MHPIENIMQTTMQQLKSMTEVDTIIGRPVSTGKVTILPVSKLSMGFLSGGGEYGSTPNKKSAIEKSSESMGERYPFAGTAVAGLTVTPMAFLSVSDDAVKVLPADYSCTLDRAIEMLPEIIYTLERAVCKKDDAPKC